MTTSVQDSHGPLNTGPGPQIIVQLLRDIGGLTGDTLESRPRGQWLEEQFTWLRARFVPPPGFPRTRGALESKRVVLLRGQPGSGRRSAAMMLLDRSEFASGRFTEIVRAFEEIDLRPLESELSLESGDRILLDLSAVDMLAFGRCVPLLPPLFGAVHSAKANLVVVLPDDYATHTDLTSLTVDHRRPDAAHALARHLRHAGIAFSESDQGHQVFDHVRQAPLRQVTLISELMVRIRSGDASAGFAAWATSALAVVQDGRARARETVTKRSGAERVLLLSAAMLTGGSTDTVWRAAEILRRKAAYPPDTEHPLDTPDFLEQLIGIGATVDGDHSVRFTNPIEAQVRDYFWDAYPKLREILGPWISEAISEGVPEQEADLLVTRLAEILFRAGRVSTVDDLIRKWARSPNRAILRQARALLELGLADERYAARFRSQMWHWAQNVTDPGLGAVLVGACTRILIQSHPDQALTRLRHLARRPEPIGQTARDALAELVRPQDRLLRRLLQRIAYSGYARDAETFLAVADPYQLTNTERRPRPLAAEPVVHGQLVEAWRTALRVQSAGWAARVESWLEAGANTQRRAMLLGILAEAADSADSRGRLFAAAHAWAGGRASCRPTLDALLDHLNAAQGIAFLAAAPEGTFR